MKQVIFTGAATALVTPFQKDGSIAWDELERLVEFQVQAIRISIWPAVPPVKQPTMTTEEHTQVIKFIIERRRAGCLSSQALAATTLLSA